MTRSADILPAERAIQRRTELVVAEERGSFVVAPTGRATIDQARARGQRREGATGSAISGELPPPRSVHVSGEAADGAGGHVRVGIDDEE
jgi:hypothetical protein